MCCSERKHVDNEEFEKLFSKRAKMLRAEAQIPVVSSTLGLWSLFLWSLDDGVAKKAGVGGTAC